MNSVRFLSIFVCLLIAGQEVFGDFVVDDEKKIKKEMRNMISLVSDDRINIQGEIKLKIEDHPDDETKVLRKYTFSTDADDQYAIYYETDRLDGEY